MANAGAQHSFHELLQLINTSQLPPRQALKKQVIHYIKSFENEDGPPDNSNPGSKEFYDRIVSIVIQFALESEVSTLTSIVRNMVQCNARAQSAALTPRLPTTRPGPCRSSKQMKQYPDACTHLPCREKAFPPSASSSSRFRAKYLPPELRDIIVAEAFCRWHGFTFTGNVETMSKESGQPSTWSVTLNRPETHPIDILVHPRSGFYHDMREFVALACSVQDNAMEYEVRDTFFAQKLGFVNCDLANQFLMTSDREPDMLRVPYLTNIYAGSDRNGTIDVGDQRFGFPYPWQFSLLVCLAKGLNKDRIIFKMIDRYKPGKIGSTNYVEYLAVFNLDHANEAAYIYLDLESYHDDHPREAPTGGFVLESDDDVATMSSYTPLKRAWDDRDARNGIKRHEYHRGARFYWEKGWQENGQLDGEISRILVCPTDKVLLVAHNLSRNRLPRRDSCANGHHHHPGASTKGFRAYIDSSFKINTEHWNRCRF